MIASPLESEVKVARSYRLSWSVLIVLSAVVLFLGMLSWFAGRAEPASLVAPASFTLYGLSQLVFKHRALQKGLEIAALLLLLAFLANLLRLQLSGFF
jgi:hypothetical protein